MHLYHYLALGDSYTIGEGVPFQKNFPSRFVHLMRTSEFQFAAPEVIAQTGWTVQELSASIENTTLLPKYDFVSLLIGVNNQYRGLDSLEYKESIEKLIKTAIALADGKKHHVVMLSIPDYSESPFASGMDRDKIKKELSVFNSINRVVAIQYDINYIDISDISASPDGSNLWTEDGLHPASIIYEQWAEKLSDCVLGLLK